MTFAAGETEQLVEVMIIDDQNYEGEEQFQGILELQSGSSGVVLGTQTTADATIQDDDGKNAFHSKRVPFYDSIIPCCIQLLWLALIQLRTQRLREMLSCSLYKYCRVRH